MQRNLQHRIYLCHPLYPAKGLLLLRFSLQSYAVPIGYFSHHNTLPCASYIQGALKFGNSADNISRISVEVSWVVLLMLSSGF